MNIGNFIQWFIQQFVNIGGFMVGKLDDIKLYGNVSLLDFTITIAIISIFISIVLTLPQNANRLSARAERRARSDKKS